MNTAELTVMPSGKSNTGIAAWRDWLGIVASIGCAIHCAAMPFVIASLPAWGLGFLADESFHKWMALICFLIAIVAFVPGLRKHRNWLPVSVGAAGLFLITFAAFGLAGECCPSCASTTTNAGADSAAVEAGCDQCDECSGCFTSDSALANNKSATEAMSEANTDKGLLSTLAPWLTPFGGLLLVSAHLLNRRFGCLCGCCIPGTKS